MSDRPTYTLFIESDREEANLVRRSLDEADEDFLLTVADRVERGKDLLGATEFDVVLVGMAGPCPVDLVGELRCHAPDTPFIILSSLDDPELRARALREGAQDYLVLEYEGDLLCRAIEFAIRRNRSRVALRAREERYELALRGAKDGLWDWDLLNHRAYYSERWREILGYTDEGPEASPDAWFERVHPDDLPRLQADLEWHFKGLTPHLENEHRMLHRDGSYRWVMCRGVAVTDRSGRNCRIAGSLTDISERKAYEEKLQRDALHDALTGLPNRALLFDRLSVAIAHAKRRGHHRFAILYLDLDGFKDVNDRFGHLVGDDLLCEVSRRLSSVLRPGDTVARLGGDEFVLLAHDAGTKERVERIAERILGCFDEPCDVGGHDLAVGTSIGIAISGNQYERPEEILRDADMALYRAKLGGKGRSEVFAARDSERAGALLELEDDLRQAIEDGSLTLHYQPIVNLHDHRLVGFEALVRWPHPVRGLLFPDDFVPLAEETGLALGLGDWVLREACRQMAVWQEEMPQARKMTVSVNLSPKHFRQRDLVDRVWSVVEESGVEASSLRLDVTEGMLEREPEAALAKVLELKALGIEVHVDNFGTGPLSLGHLHRLPAPTLKIDRSFVSSLDTAGPSVEVMGALVALARALGMTVSAEGLETETQVAAMRDLACDYGQGHFFSQALDAHAARDLIRGERAVKPTRPVRRPSSGRSRGA